MDLSRAWRGLPSHRSFGIPGAPGDLRARIGAGSISSRRATHVHRSFAATAAPVALSISDATGAENFDVCVTSEEVGKCPRRCSAKPSYFCSWGPWEALGGCSRTCERGPHPLLLAPRRPLLRLGCLTLMLLVTARVASHGIVLRVYASSHSPRRFPKQACTSSHQSTPGLAARATAKRCATSTPWGERRCRLWPRRHGSPRVGYLQTPRTTRTPAPRRPRPRPRADVGIRQPPTPRAALSATSGSATLVARGQRAGRRRRRRRRSGRRGLSLCGCRAQPPASWPGLLQSRASGPAPSGARTAARAPRATRRPPRRTRRRGRRRRSGGLSSERARAPAARVQRCSVQGRVEAEQPEPRRAPQVRLRLSARPRRSSETSPSASKEQRAACLQPLPSESEILPVTVRRYA